MLILKSERLAAGFFCQMEAWIHLPGEISQILQILFCACLGSKNSNYNITGPIDEEMEVDAIMGAYFLTRREVIDKVGLLDEEFFMYGEDLDWCYRIKQAGYKVIYYPGAQITHFKYGASKTVPFKVIRWAHDAMKIFYSKHYAQEHNWFFNRLVFLGINLRMVFVYMQLTCSETKDQCNNFGKINFLC
jgi:GT2 family glycosyltransferase